MDRLSEGSAGTNSHRCVNRPVAIIVWAQANSGNHRHVTKVNRRQATILGFFPDSVHPRRDVNDVPKEGQVEAAIEACFARDVLSHSYRNDVRTFNCSC